MALLGSVLQVHFTVGTFALKIHSNTQATKIDACVFLFLHITQSNFTHFSYTSLHTGVYNQLELVQQGVYAPHPAAVLTDFRGTDCMTLLSVPRVTNNQCICNYM